MMTRTHGGHEGMASRLGQYCINVTDLEKSVDFYTNVLGMPLVKTLEIPGGAQHFFFDCGNGDSVAFFWFPHAPEAAPGIAAAGEMPVTRTS